MLPANAEDDDYAKQQTLLLLDTGKIAKLYRPRLFWVLVPCFIYFLALFITVPIAVQVLVAVVCESLEEQDCNSSRVSSEASLINLYVSLGSTVPSFLLSGMYGSIADVYGRKCCILVPMLGYLCYTILLLYIDARRPANFRTLYIGCALLIGLTGSFAVFQMAVFSYAADITGQTKTKRASRGVVYSMLESCLFGAKIIGPICAGLYAQKHGFVVPLSFSVALCCAGLLWAALMPESLPPDAPSRSHKVVLDPFKTLRNLYLITIKGGISSPIPPLSLAFFLYFASYMGAQQISLLYVKHQFSWGPRTIGYYDCVEGIMQLSSMLAVPWLITKVAGVYHDPPWLLAGYAARSLHFLLFSLASSTREIFAISLLLLLCGPLTPRTRAILSNATPPSQQASVLSAFSALQSMSQFAAPGFAAGYSVTVFTDPGAMYKAFAALTLASAVILLYAISFGLLSVYSSGGTGGTGGGEKGDGRDAAGTATGESSRAAAGWRERRALSSIGEESDDEDEEDGQGGARHVGRSLSVKGGGDSASPLLAKLLDDR